MNEKQAFKNKQTKITITIIITNLSINNLIAANKTTCTFHVFEVRAVVSIEQKRSPYLSVRKKMVKNRGKIGSLEVTVMIGI